MEGQRQALRPAERLIVAADFEPRKEMGSPRADVKSQVITLATQLIDTGVYLKIESALRACGYGLIDEIHARGLRVFADLKLFGTEKTFSIDSTLLREVRPDILTVSAFAGKRAMQTLKAELPDTEILVITLLTDLTVQDVRAMVPGSDGILDSSIILQLVGQLGILAAESGMDGVVAAPAEAAILKRVLPPHMTVNTPNVRPTWSTVEEDDQNLERSATPAKAIGAGTDRIVVGRPITQHENPRKATKQTIEEINWAWVPR